MNAYSRLLREICNDIPDGVFASAELDFKNPKHQECVAAQFGGLAHMTNRYPGLAECYKHTVSNPFPVPNADTDGFVDGASIIDLGYLDIEKAIFALGNVTLTEQADRLYITMYVYEEDKLVFHESSFEHGTYGKNMKVKSEERPKLDVGKSYYVYLQATWEPKESNGLRSMVAKAESPVVSADAVSSITVTAPIHIVSAEDSTINVSYERLSNDADYSYAETRDAKGNEAIFIPVSGTIELADNYHIDDLNQKPIIGAALRCNYYGDIIYGGSTLYGSKGAEKVVLYPLNDEKTGLEWCLEKRWNKSIPYSVQYGNRIHDIDIGIEFRLQEDEQIHRVSITSIDTDLLGNQKNTKIISKIKLLWGCLAEGTEIMMADGTCEKIENIKTGDKVMQMSEQGLCEAVVKELVTGTEETIYVLHLENGMEVKATRTHVFFTEEKCVETIDLTSKEKVKTAKGSFFIKYCYPENYGGNVYNLELETGDNYIAGGIVSGTNRLMGEVADKKEKERTQITVNPDIEEECRCLREDFNMGLI